MVRAYRAVPLVAAVDGREITGSYEVSRKLS
jgi:hypothetical protein